MPPLERHRLAGLAVLLAAAMLLLVSWRLPLHAQSPETEPVLVVRVIDQLDRPVPSATVRVAVTRQALAVSTQTTDATGVARFVGLAMQSRFEVRVTANGFTPYRERVSHAALGRRDVVVQLLVPGPVEHVTVTAPRKTLDALVASAATVLTREDLLALPDDPDEFEAALKAIAGADAEVRVDGFRAPRLPKKADILYIKISRDAYSAEFHDPGGVYIDIVTRSRVDAWTGDWLLAGRHAALDARNAFAAARPDGSAGRTSLGVAGPAGADGGIGANINLGSVSTVQTVVDARGGAGGTRDSRRRSWAADATFSRTLGAQRFRAWINGGLTRTTNVGLSGLDTAERAYAQRVTVLGSRMALSGRIHRAVFHELRAFADWQETRFSPTSDDATNDVLGVVRSGGAGVNGRQTSGSGGLHEQFDIQIAKHALRAGVELHVETVRSDVRRNTNGTFRYSDLSALIAASPLQYSVATGLALVRRPSSQVALYVQDNVRLGAQWLGSFGIRQEVQSGAGAGATWCPRGSLTWKPTDSGRTSISVNAGRFSEWADGDTLLRVEQLDGAHLAETVTVFGDETATTGLVGTSVRTYALAAHLRRPTTWKLEGSLHQRLWRASELHVAVSHERASGEWLSLVGDNDTVGNVLVTSKGRSTGRTLSVGLSSRISRLGTVVSATYRLASVWDSRESPLAIVSDSLDPDADWGPSASDVRHRLLVAATAKPRGGLRVSGTLTASSATPYTITTGVDTNGDTVLNDRPLGTSRNGARGAGQVSLAARLSWTLGVGAPRATTRRVTVEKSDGVGLDSISIAANGSPEARSQVEFFVSARNVFNHVNRGGYVGVIGSPHFGRATVAGEARRLELGAKVSF